MQLTLEPHHDGSEAYVPAPAERLGDETTVRLRIPRGTDAGTVAVRYLHDGEPRAARAVLDAETATDTWWRASFPVSNPLTRYRWLLAGGGAGYAWVNGGGLVRHDVPDDDDFVAVPAGESGPEWHLRSVVYEIFPDRFAASGATPELPGWAVPRAWGTPPIGRGHDTPHEWYGGDLDGIAARLDHVQALGADTLYLTPLFPAGSTHRYDASSFERIDPGLGGDDALIRLTSAAHRRGLRVIGDLTLNHCGVDHDWFRAALQDAACEERGFFTFDDGVLHGYETWLGVRTLPKLDHRSAALRRRLVDGPASIVQRWLREPFGLDGWRIDVANMAGRRGASDLCHELAADVRRAVDEARADGLLLAEHGHDYRGDLRGDGWHGVMNYAGFLRPVWCWLRGDGPQDGFLGLPVELPRLPGEAVVRTMREFRAGVPWNAALHSWSLLDSHDTPRFSHVAGSPERQAVGIGLQMTLPGVPMVWAGDEIGLGGEWGEDARRTMPWDDPGSWDTAVLSRYRELIALRRSSSALAAGGLRLAHVSADAIAYLREDGTERLLCLALRAPVALRGSLAELGCRELEVQYGSAAHVHGDTFELPGHGPAFHVWRLA